MKTRIISGIIMIVPLIAFLYFGGIPLLCLCLAASAIGIYEFYKGYENIGVHADRIWAFGMLAALYIIILIRFPSVFRKHIQHLHYLTSYGVAM